MSLKTKYRPSDLDQMCGNQQVIRSIEGLLNPIERFPHTILFTGDKGTGKTTMARILPKRLGIMPIDYQELDTAQFGNKDTIQKVIAQTRLRPMDPQSRARMWLLDECHMIGVGGDSEKNKAQATLLKTLEEPPKHVYFVLATTDPQRLFGPLRERATEFKMQPLNEPEMNKLLIRVCKAEKIRLPRDIMELIYEQSAGGPRAALGLLEQVIGLQPKEMEDVIREEAIKQNRTIELWNVIIEGKPWGNISKVLQGLSGEAEEGIRRYILKCCEQRAIKGKGFDPRLLAIYEEFERPFWDNGWQGLVFACYRARFVEV